MVVVKTALGIDGQGSQAQTHSVGLQCNMTAIPIGVQGWLGWEEDVKPDDWARDIKQLPTQRPIKPIVVTIRHHCDK